MAQEVLSGYIVKAHTPGYGQVYVGAMSTDLDVLIEAIADAFSLHPHALKLLSPPSLWVLCALEFPG